MLRKVARPCSMPATMRGEVVVEQHEVGGLAGDVGAGARPWRCRCRPRAGPARRSRRRRSWPRRDLARAAPGRCAASPRARPGRRRCRRGRASAPRTCVVGGEVARRSGPGSSPARRPTSVAMAAAVAGWSPVIMATLMPARRQAAIASLDVLAGRVLEREEPEQVEVRSPRRPARSGGALGERSAGDGEDPQPLAGQRLEHRGAARRRPAHSGSTASGAPLTSTSPSTTTDIRRRRGSNGNRRGAGHRCDRRRCRRRAGGRTTSSAASIGSPWARHSPVDR